MHGQDGNTSGPFDLAAMHINPADIRSVVVHTGKLEWLSYAKDEMITLVVPYGVAEGEFFGLYHQWTVDAQGVEKANVRVNGVFQNVQFSAWHRSIIAEYKAEYYTYKFSFGGNVGSLELSNPRGDTSQGNRFTVTYTRS